MNLINFNRLLQMLERDVPTLWRKCYPRTYDSLGKWHSPKIPAVCLANAVVTAHHLGLGRSGGVNSQYLAACLVDQHKVPTFFVTAALLQSANETDLPEDMRWTDIPMPHPGMVFMFERGSVSHPTMGEIAFACCGRIPALASLQHSFPGSPVARVRGGGFVALSAGHETAAFDCVDLTMSEEMSPTVAGLTQASLLDRDLTSPLDFKLSADEKSWNKWITLLCIKIVLVMNARPEIVSTGSLQRIIKPKHPSETPKEIWTPNVIGRGFHCQRENIDATGRHVRMHWRRGHFRQQPFGPKRGQRKTLWIEPMLVGVVG